MSASTKSAALDQLSGRCRAIPTTSWPWLSNRAARPRPSTPPAPVTAILTECPQGTFAYSCLLVVVVHECGVDQAVEVHVREVFFRVLPEGHCLPVSGGFTGFIRQREQQLQHACLSKALNRNGRDDALDFGFSGRRGRGVTD